jgi:uncharacterized protein (DUF2236 family)
VAGNSPESLGPVADIGPDTLLWEYAGDRRNMLTGLSYGILELMHPAIGAGVAEHSNFFDDPMDRIRRSVSGILGPLYDVDGESTGHTVRDYHTAIKGVDESGRRYHALDPETFWWAHATFHRNIEHVIDRFSSRVLDEQNREQLYGQSKEWYRRYGVSMLPVPADQAAFNSKWEHTCSSILEMTPAAEHAVNMAVDERVDRLLAMPPIIWRLGKIPTGKFVRIITIGGLPEGVRQRFDIPWSERDAAGLEKIEASVRRIWPLLPERARYFPQARAGRARAVSVAPRQSL